MYYNKQGEPIPVEEWARLFEDDDYKRVALDEGKGWRLSTVWLGLDHNFYDQGPPMIFETMLFTDLVVPRWNSIMQRFTTQEENGMNRYSTEQQALEGHKEFLDEIYLVERSVSD